MTVIKKQRVGNRIIWLCAETPPAQWWATYISHSDDDYNATEHGHYFPALETAEKDFSKRINEQTTEKK